MKKFLFLGLLLWGSLSLAGNQPFPRTGVLPEQITTADSVRVGIANMLSPCLGTGDMYPTFYHLANDNHITFVLAAMIVEPCPNQPGFGLQYDVGVLSEGNYTLQVYVVGSPDDVPITINDPLGTPLGELVEFSVQGVGVATPVSFLSEWSIGLLILSFYVIYIFISEKKTNFFNLCPNFLCKCLS